MHLTHFGHSCLLVATDQARLLFDPGAFSSGFEEARDLDAVLITHKHPDHLDLDRLPALLQANPGATLIADPGSAEALTSAGLRPHLATPDAVITVAGLPVRAVGGTHAVIHPDLPGLPNVGYLLAEGAFLHPGDSFVVPEQAVDVLALPTAAPWMKLSEAVDYLRAVQPRLAVPIHEAVLAMPRMHYDRFTELAPEGTRVRVLPRGEATAV
ncbi:MBL fold metallo-hydrolase [Actinoalloteichus sp. AHMU CJ021]|uniref:L-ascorbate metabolism protein UlaG, beta-lactamase superfamily n=1 Tax=Actinoalloteichus caeruleus DSM 43889 TaxID=1120930 RepID=A0ABT1JL13_ACTCY|nr:MBL fold metallo-hydrolase [Actinoalloteichus caeruleus]AUS78967.1 MBL fold metallo-hydrolase [Actinoalloteichus sp. AHMU CJ021]MCP2333185.1 L-ascorbate metabolism protein UlaG, beta-lactamase superfamily [Actinoalloteichus caeruleus DSM 43889]